MVMRALFLRQLVVSYFYEHLVICTFGTLVPSTVDHRAAELIILDFVLFYFFVFRLIVSYIFKFK